MTTTRLRNNPEERSSQGNVCLKCRVTPEDIWVHHFTPQTQSAGMQWNTTVSPGEKNSVCLLAKLWNLYSKV